MGTLLVYRLEKAREQVPARAPILEGEDRVVRVPASGMQLREQRERPMVALPAVGAMRRRESAAAGMREVGPARWRSKPD